jgi:hypothetical protein
MPYAGSVRWLDGRNCSSSSEVPHERQAEGRQASPVRLVLSAVAR